MTRDDESTNNFSRPYTLSMAFELNELLGYDEMDIFVSKICDVTK